MRYLPSFRLALAFALLPSCTSPTSSVPVPSSGGSGGTTTSDTGGTTPAGGSAAGGAAAGGTPSAGGAGSGSAVGGTATGGALGEGGAGADGDFQLLFRDDFDSLDNSRWQLMTHSWDSNLAIFSSESVSVANGEMKITLLAAPEGTTLDGAAKQFYGAEVRSKDTITYGRVRARAKLAAGSAVVSSLVTIYTPWPADNWNELDIEYLGKELNSVQFNAMVYTGALPAPSTPVSPTQDPTMYDLGFDASAAFHEYDIEWTPAGATFRVDGQVAHTWTKNIALMTLPQNVLLTIWASNSASWAGPVNETTTGASATYDWVEVYQYQGAPQN